jgi:hypothetical protein
MSCVLVEQELGRGGGYFSHLGDDGALASVVVNPLLVVTPSVSGIVTVRSNSPWVRKPSADISPVVVAVVTQLVNQPHE